MTIIIGADHRGFKLKERVKKFLMAHHFEVIDVGAETFDEKDDYTLFSEKVALLVTTGKNHKGILLCGSGVGVDITANKFDGVRASMGLTPKQVKAGRADDDMNILVLAADFTTPEKAEQLTKSFLYTEFDEGTAHKRRIQEIARIEENN